MRRRVGDSPVISVAARKSTTNSIEMNVPDSVLAAILDCYITDKMLCELFGYINCTLPEGGVLRKTPVAVMRLELVCHRWRRLLVGTLQTKALVTFWNTIDARLERRNCPSCFIPQSHVQYGSDWLDANGGNIFVPYGGPTLTRKRAYIRLRQRCDALDAERFRSNWQITVQHLLAHNRLQD